MEIFSDIKNNDCVIYLIGELDELTAPLVRCRLDEIIDSLNFKQNVILDFAKVNFMDSTGIGVLFGRYKKFAESRISFFISNPNSTIDRIMQMTGIYKLMPKSA